VTVKRVAALVSARQFDRAVEEASAALATDPESTRLWHLLALAEYGRGNSRAALPAIERVLAADTDRADVFVHHGWILRALGRHGEAVEAFERALAIDPGYVDAHVYLARALTAGGTRTPPDVRQRALRHAERARELAPDAVETHLVNASVLMADPGQHGLALAEESVQAALALDPRNTEALRLNALVQLQRRRAVRAIRAYADVLMLDPHDRVAARNLALGTWILFARLHFVVLGLLAGAWIGGAVAPLLDSVPATVLRVVLVAALVAVTWFVLIGRPARAFPPPMRRAAMILIRRDTLLRPHSLGIAWAVLASLAVVAVPWPQGSLNRICVSIGFLGYAVGTMIARRRLRDTSARRDAERLGAWLAVAASVRRPAGAEPSGLRRESVAREVREGHIEEL